MQIVPTKFIKKQESTTTLLAIAKALNWGKMVIKPAISAAAFHTYIVKANDLEHENIFQQLLKTRDMLVQEFQETIKTKGEASLMIFNGIFTHAILKKAKKNDFRVQDDFGGTVHHYTPTPKEIAFAEKTYKQCPHNPVYGRVDIMWDEEDDCYLSEVEFLDPEIWLRNAPEKAQFLADAIIEYGLLSLD